MSAHRRSRRSLGTRGVAATAIVIPTLVLAAPASATASATTTTTAATAEESAEGQHRVAARAAGKRAIDVKGIVTVRHAGTQGRNQFDLQYRATLLGSVPSSGWAPANVTALRHLVRTYNYNPDTGKYDICTKQSFLRWTTGGAYPAGRGQLTFRVPKVNRATNTAKVDVRFIPTDPYGVVGTGSCGGGTDFTTTKPLIAQEPSSLVNPPSLLGNGGPEMGYMTQQDLFSPRWITLKRSHGFWRSVDSRTTTSTTNRSHKVTVSWNLRSRNPSTQCALPAPKSMRGKSVAKAKKQLRKYGFAKTHIEKVSNTGFRKGRVTAFGSWNSPGALTCGKRVDLFVAR